MLALSITVMLLFSLTVPVAIKAQEEMIPIIAVFKDKLDVESLQV